MTPFSIRLDPKDLAKARELGIDVAELTRLALRKEIKKRSVRCKCCGGGEYGPK